MGDTGKPLDPRQFRDVIGLFTSGVAVVATQVDDDVHAMTANAVSSLSLEPMLVLFCPGKKASFSRHFAKAQAFTINILREEQQALSTYFAGAWRGAAAPPFRFVPSRAAPRLEGCLASIDCEKFHVADGGDHWLVIGKVVAMHRGIEPHRPLLFYKGQYRSVDFSSGAPAPDLIRVEDEPPHIFYDG
jgi:flavin reductase (DIM6/NTAB) family NADH-FMN oxidoreductase RutF